MLIRYSEAAEGAWARRWRGLTELRFVNAGSIPAESTIFGTQRKKGVKNAPFSKPLENELTELRYHDYIIRTGEKRINYGAV